MSFNIFWKSFNIFKYLSTPDLSPVSENRTEHLEQSLVAVTNGSQPEILVSSVSSALRRLGKSPTLRNTFSPLHDLNLVDFKCESFKLVLIISRRNLASNAEISWNTSGCAVIPCYSFNSSLLVSQFPRPHYPFQHAKAFSKDLQRGQGMHRIEPIWTNPIIINNNHQ